MNLNIILEKKLTSRWIAGPYINNAILDTKKFNKLKITSMINYLGENFDNLKNIEASIDLYTKLIKEIKKNNLNANISIKPTQLGLLINNKILVKNYLKLISIAEKANIFVWLDMEESKYIDDIIKLYLKAIENKKKNIGICIQSYLKRSNKDIKQICLKQGIIRLVKGAYKEPNKIAYTSWIEITQNYIKLMKYLFINSNNFMIATHDLNIINKALKLKKQYKRRVKFAMLKGIKNKYLIGLAKTQIVFVYIPFGTKWFGYSLRRLKEIKNLKLIIKSLFENQNI